MHYTKGPLLKETLRQRCTHNQLRLYFFSRWFYAFKAFLCILLGRYKDVVYENHEHFDGTVKGVAKLDVSNVPWHPNPKVLCWSEILVGRGVFGNWYYDIYLNSTEDQDVFLNADTKE